MVESRNNIGCFLCAHFFFRHPPFTPRESSPLSADAIVQPPKDALVKPVVLPAALANPPVSLSALLPTLELATMPILEPKPTPSTIHEETPYPRLTLPLPGCSMSRPSGRPALPSWSQQEPLNKTPRKSPRTDDSLLPHPYHNISFTPNSALRSTRPASNAIEEGVLVAQFSSCAILTTLPLRAQPVP